MTASGMAKKVGFDSATLDAELIRNMDFAYPDPIWARIPYTGALFAKFLYFYIISEYTQSSTPPPLSN